MPFNKLAENAKSKTVLTYSTDYSKHKDFLLSLFNRKNKREVKTRLYGSEASFCHRKNAFSSEFPTEYDENIIQTFRQNFGHAAEAAWVSALLDSGNLVTNDFKVCDIKDNVSDEKNELYLPSNVQLNYSAKIDFIYRFNSELVLADSKCSSSIPDKLPLNYIRQLQFYSAVTGLPAVLIYTTPQKGVFKEFEWELFEIDTSKKSLIEALEIAYLSTFCIQEKLILPKQDEMFKTTTCKYCNFSQYCYSETELDFYPFSEPEIEIEMELRQRATHAAYDFYNETEKRKQIILEYLTNDN